HAPDNPALRRDVNRLLNATNLGTNTLGGAAVAGGLNPYDLCGGDAPQPAKCLPNEQDARQPHTTPSARSPLRGLSQLNAGWDNFSALYRNELPGGSRDVSGFQAVQ